jgi:hypothetical protein
MFNTSQPIRKFLALAFIVMIIALVSQSVFAAKGGKPPPEPQPSQVVLVDADGKMMKT